MKKKQTGTIEKQSVETIYEEIVQYLKTRTSRYFRFDPKEPREEAILQVFSRSSDEKFRNKLRKAVHICFGREDLFHAGFEFMSRLLVLVDEMNVTQTRDKLLELALMDNFSGISPDQRPVLKNHMIEILLKFDISQIELKEIIDQNIADPDYTETCLAASTLLIPRFKSFVRYFPTALNNRLAYPEKVRLDSVLRVCLDRMGKATWRKEGAQLLWADESMVGKVLELFATAGLDPQFFALDDNESTLEFLIKWPFAERDTGENIGLSVSTYLLNLTNKQKKMIQQAVIDSGITAQQARPPSLYTDTGNAPTVRQWLKGLVDNLKNVKIWGTGHAAPDLPISFTATHY